jgi:hypothetical protein
VAAREIVERVVAAKERHDAIGEPHGAQLRRHVAWCYRDDPEPAQRRRIVEACEHLVDPVLVGAADHPRDEPQVGPLLREVIEREQVAALELGIELGRQEQDHDHHVEIAQAARAHEPREPRALAGQLAGEIIDAVALQLDRVVVDRHVPRLAGALGLVFGDRERARIRDRPPPRLDREISTEACAREVDRQPANRVVTHR